MHAQVTSHPGVAGRWTLSAASVTMTYTTLVRRARISREHQHIIFRRVN